MKTTFHQRIGTVKFSSLFKASPCSPVVTFPSFGSEGHGVQPRRGTPVLLVVLIYFPFCFVVVVVVVFFSCLCWSQLEELHRVSEERLKLWSSFKQYSIWIIAGFHMTSLNFKLQNYWCS